MLGTAKENGLLEVDTNFNLYVNPTDLLCALASLRESRIFAYVCEVSGFLDSHQDA